ncbi:META domain-containing protein [Motilimonas eburnea]|uniref:META domain-containing protein n=1 Tax=Motilimonas eburnea TaxID=1737488 RepID=UPI001E42403D|nr:META domain-containing protein [Motilimonas eburnea]MCE2573469.1 META domain-containing protein [Motilimonas eburnea]
MKSHFRKAIIVSSVLFAVGALQACSKAQEQAQVAPNESNASTEVEAPVSEQKEATNMVSLSTQVLYLDRSMLPEGAQVSVSLLDVSIVGGEPLTLAEQIVTVQGGPPYALTLEYDQNQIQANHKYGLAAKIKLADKLLYQSTDYLDPFSEALSGNVEIVVKKLPEPTAQAEFKNTYWKLISIGDNPVPTVVGARELFVQFMLEENQVRGFSGCNNFMGNYQLDGHTVQLTPMAGTRKMCPSGMEQEQAFLQAFTDVVGYQIEGENLKLQNAAGETLLAFESRYMN